MTIQNRIYDMLIQRQQDGVIPPSLQGISTTLNIPSRATVHKHLKVMRQAGLVTWLDRKCRTVSAITQHSLESHNA